MEALEAGLADVQSLCELGQQQLMEMRYLQAERTLVAAEGIAWRAGDLETIARLYMPLQECRRQRRQRCGEGTVCLDLIAESAADHLEARHVLENFPHGQLLVAGWGSIEPARQVRAMAAAREMYVETFLAAVYPIESQDRKMARVIVLIALEDASLPPPEPIGLKKLLGKLPPHSILLNRVDLPAGPQRGTAQTYGRAMAMWERLHRPFLAAADSLAAPMEKIEAYRTAIRVDYACELAHQKLSEAARLAGRTQGFAVSGQSPA